MNVNVIDYVEAADHHLDLPDAQVEEKEEVVVEEPVSLTNIVTMLRNAHAFRELLLVWNDTYGITRIPTTVAGAQGCKKSRISN